MDTLGSFTSQCIAKSKSSCFSNSFMEAYENDPLFNEILPASPLCEISFVVCSNEDENESTTNLNNSTAGDECYCPSEQTFIESLAGEDDIWMCDICSHYNSGSKSSCSLCCRGRNETLISFEFDENEFSLSKENDILSFLPCSGGSFSNSSPISPNHSRLAIARKAVSAMTNPVQELPTSISKPPRGNSPSAQPVVKARRGRKSNAERALLMKENALLNTPYKNRNSAPHFASPGKDSITSVSSGEVYSSSPNYNSKIPGNLYRPNSTSLDSSFDEDDEDAYLMAMPNQIGPFSCPHTDCKEVVADSKSLHLHISQHKWGPHDIIIDEEGNQSYICRHFNCDKISPDRKILRKHMLTHREKVFACHYPECDRKFYERAKLKRHFLVHTGEKPFVCPFDQCGKKFGYNANLKTHMRTHTGARPFTCNVQTCKRTFAQASNRNAHILTCTGVRNNEEDEEDDGDGEYLDGENEDLLESEIMMGRKRKAGSSKQRATKKPKKMTFV